MRTPAFAIAMLAASVFPAAAQPIAEQMTCQQAIDYFAANGVIYKTVRGNVMPIRQGIPIGYALPGCYGPGYKRFTYRIPTLDTPRCVISHYCITTF